MRVISQHTNCYYAKLYIYIYCFPSQKRSFHHISVEEESAQPLNPQIPPISSSAQETRRRQSRWLVSWLPSPGGWSSAPRGRRGGSHWAASPAPRKRGWWRRVSNWSSSRLNNQLMILGQRQFVVASTARMSRQTEESVAAQWL